MRGLSVLVLDRGELGAGTSRVAAGMLAPVAEADASERALLALGLQSAQRWPAFATELVEVSGIDVGYRTCGTLMLARDRDEAEALERERDLRERFGLRVERLLPSAARRLEPALAPTLRSALHLPDDHAVDPRLVCAALARAAKRAGAVLRPGAEVDDLAALPAEQVVVAAGPWSGAFGDEARVRPVKGQSLRLRDPSGPGLLERVVRWGQPSPGYLVPRGDGRYVLGATSGSAASTPRSPPAACTSCCATRTSSCPACSSSRSRSTSPACVPARPTTRRSSAARMPTHGSCGPPATTATACCWRPSRPTSWSPS
jgi:glycine oxidase